MKSLLKQSSALSVFGFIFCMAIGCHLIYDRAFLVPRGEMVWSYYLLVIFVFIAGFWQRFQNIFLVVASILFYVVLKSALKENTPGNGLYGTWNHAIVFWTFLCLAFRKLWGDTRTIFAIKFLLVMAYFAAGVAKVGQTPSWANGYTLQYYLLGRMIHTGSPPLWKVLTSLEFAQVVSYLVIVMELLSPLALLRRCGEWVFVVTTLIFQFCNWYYMDILWMKYFGWVYLIFFLDWFYNREIRVFQQSNK